jgi:hypothetical protein
MSDISAQYAGDRFPHEGWGKLQRDLYFNCLFKLTDFFLESGGEERAIQLVSGVFKSSPNVLPTDAFNKLRGIEAQLVRKGRETEAAR